MEVSGQLHAPAALPPGWVDLRVSLDAVTKIKTNPVVASAGNRIVHPLA
jgi:hypothetical protein